MMKMFIIIRLIVKTETIVKNGCVFGRLLTCFLALLYRHAWFVERFVGSGLISGIVRVETQVGRRVVGHSAAPVRRKVRAQPALARHGVPGRKQVYADPAPVRLPHMQACLRAALSQRNR